MIPKHAPARREVTSSPRTRGDDPSKVLTEAALFAFSPHPRG